LTGSSTVPLAKGFFRRYRTALRRFQRVTRVCFPEVTHLVCNQDCN
jgi:hypothetical protein